MSPETPPQTLPDLFRAAAHLIADYTEAGLPLLRGLYRNTATTPPCYCTLGALLAAAGTPATIGADRLVLEAVRYLAPRVDSLSESDDPDKRVADWHDDPDRTPAEVVAALLKAARDSGAPVTADAAHLAVQAHEYDPMDAAYRAAGVAGQAVAS